MVENKRTFHWLEEQPPFPQPIAPDPWMGLSGVEGETIDVTTKEGLEFLQWTRGNPVWDFLKRSGEKHELTYTPKLVLLFGPSGSGKDSAVDQIKQLGDDRVLHISSDWYYGPFGQTRDKFILANDFDHPNSIDWDLLHQNLEHLRQGYTVQAPDYDFPTRSRPVDRSHKLEPRPLIVVSGILVANDPKLREKADVVIGVYADWDTCVERRVKRDVQERERIASECYEQIEKSVKPMFEEFVKPHMLAVEEAWRKGEEKYVWIDNSKNTESPENFPVVISSEVYLSPLRALLES